MDMQVHITGRGIKLTEALKAKAHDKLARAIAPLCDDTATSIDIELISEAHQSKSDSFECRVHLHLPHENTLVIHEQEADMYTAIDGAEARLLEVVKERRDRSHNHHSAQKQAARDRARIARDNLTTKNDEPADEQWRREEEAYNRSQARALN